MPNCVLSFLFLFAFFPSVLHAQEHASHDNSDTKPVLESARDGGWRSLPPVNEPTERHENAFVAHDGALYLLGGRGIKPAQRFDPGTNTWSTGAYPPFQMHHFQAVTMNDLIYVVGAYSGTCCDAEFGVSHVYTYDPANDSWTQRHEIPEGRRRGSTGAVAHNGKIYIVGGLNGGHGTPATSYSWFDEYNPATGAWKVLPSAPRKRDHFHATVINNKLYVIGGRDTSDPSVTGKTISEIDVFNFNTGMWTTLGVGANLPTPRGGTASVVYNGEIVVMGGETSNQTLAHTSTEAFDPISNSWRDLAPLNVGRHGTQASVLNGKVYIAAGSAQKGGSPELNSIERFENEVSNQVTVSQLLKPGWNLIGLPLDMDESAFDQLYNDVDLNLSSRPLAWDNGYERVSSLEFGAGYWLKLNEGGPFQQEQSLVGTPVRATSFSLKKGWNLVTGISCDNVIVRGTSTDPVAAIPTSAIYSFDEGYEPAFSSNYPRGILNQGKGYWVRASKAATLNLDCGTGKQMEEDSNNPPTLAGFDALHFFDENGKSQTLLLGGSSFPEGINVSLPPKAPAGYFDVRFSNNKRLHIAETGRILLQAGKAALHVEFIPDSPSNYGYRISFLDEGIVVHQDFLKPGDRLLLDAAYDQLEVSREKLAERPDRFALHGNYPNPFNPVTTIEFDLPEPGQVRIEVYNMLGQRVLETPAQVFQAGSRQAFRLDASDLSTGTYLYRLLIEQEQGHMQYSSSFSVVK